MSKDLLVYDVDWWILGYKARIIKKYHPNLDILSTHKIKQLIKKEGAQAVNREYNVISTLSVGISAYLLKKKVRVDSTQVGGYNYFSKNIDTYREWCDEIILNYDFINKVLKRIDRLGAANPKLTEVIKKLAPNSEVNYMRHFVDSDHFKPLNITKSNNGEMVIGWVGNKRRTVKNYKTLYKPIVNAFKHNSKIKFVEATQKNIKPIEEMPQVYNSLDLLIITSSNEGAPGPAMEAYSCGVPVLATNVGYIKTVAHSKAKSLILDSDVSDDFIKKINFLLSNPDVLKDIKKGSRKNILAHWTIENTIEDWLSTLFNI